MLIVRRRTGQSVLIGGNIEIQILEAGQGRVKLGINAPPDIPVLRNEVWLTQQQNLAASQRASHGSVAALLARSLRIGGRPQVTPTGTISGHDPS